VVKSLEKLGNLARVAGNADPNGIVAGENIIENLLTASQLMLTSLTLLASPKLVLLRKALLELDLGGQGLDVGLAGAVIAGADANTLTKPLLDDGLKAVGLGKLQALEGLVGSNDAAGQRRGVVRLEVGHTLVLESGLEVGIGLVGFAKTRGSEKGVFPDGSAITRLLAPVALYPISLSI
jgi:hypothetical protein